MLFIRENEVQLTKLAQFCSRETINHSLVNAWEMEHVEEKLPGLQTLIHGHVLIDV